MLPPLPDLAVALAARLAHPLPGHAAHAEMAPYPARTDPSVISVEGKTARRAATVVLLLPSPEGEARFVLTVRHAGLRDHSGQVSLPGGRIEPGETPEQAALREAREEVGVPESAPSILGRLTPLYIPPSRFAVWPIVAVVGARPTFVTQEAEVAELLDVPLASLLDPAVRRVAPRDLGGARAEVPYFDLGGHQVWGATAMMLAEFAAVVRGALEGPGR